MNANEIVQDIYQAAVEIPEPYSSLSDDERDATRELLARFQNAEREFGPLPHRDLLLPMLISKNGRYAEALDWTERRHREAPDWNTAVAVANAARRSGDVDRAADMFAEAAEHDPSDVTCFMEIGDIRLEQDEYDKALAAYEKALAKESDHKWALPSAFY